VITPTLEKWGKYDLLAHMQKYFKSRFEPGMSILGLSTIKAILTLRLGFMGTWQVNLLFFVSIANMTQSMLNTP
jgi:hypothetical protein